ncbi:hypothetical protein T03_15910 [Trichinella britovi]|uniref:Uncharacterized protein n=1 Tax=Trichinella britovi TaxID=45882 RepID=A0A0V1C9P1_TRIBR|nr:hypothetical protein T03_15910 [Trichinella britovi]
MQVQSATVFPLFRQKYPWWKLFVAPGLMRISTCVNYYGDRVLSSTIFPRDEESFSPLATLAGTNTTSLATSLVTSPLEVRICAALSTLSRPGNSWEITPIRQHVWGRLSSRISTRSLVYGLTCVPPHLRRGSRVVRQLDLHLRHHLAINCCRYLHLTVYCKLLVPEGRQSGSRSSVAGRST